jgi:acetyl esterase/lipase
MAAIVTVLVLHGGGFDRGSPTTVEPIATDLRAAGYRTIVVPYLDENPSGNVLGEIATVKRYADNAKLRGPVIAYGISAGGTLAGALAARGEVDGAVVASGPTNLLTLLNVSADPTGAQKWRALGMSRADRRTASPYYRLDGRQSPQLLLYGDVDLLVPLEQGINYYRAAAKGQRDTSFRIMTLTPHTIPPLRYRVQARQWIQARWPARG